MMELPSQVQLAILLYHVMNIDCALLFRNLAKFIKTYSEHQSFVVAMR
jgi:hypothetical protein